MDGSVFTVSGTGPMYDHWKGEPVWYRLTNQITELRIGQGVTAIGVYALSGFSILPQIVLPPASPRFTTLASTAAALSRW